MAVAILVSGLLLAWNSLLMQPLQVQRTNAAQQITQLSQQIEDIHRHTEQTVQHLHADDDSTHQARVAALKQELEALSTKQQSLAIQFIRPQQMTELLRGLLAREAGLKLTRLQSISAEPMILPAASKSSVEKAKQALGAEPKEPHENLPGDYPQIYKHGVTIEFIGDYLGTLRYLRSLEALPWRFYWDRVSYEVLQHPRATISISVYTLSLDKGWIGV